MSDLTVDRLRNLLQYDPETGIFTWRKDRRTGKSGCVAGSAHSKGYVKICVDHRDRLAHRLAWLYVYGELPVGQIDHIDGDKKNNRISNLRQANNSENQQNLHGPKSNKTQGSLGTSYCAKYGKWRAKIKVNGKSKSLGYYQTEPEAYAAYLKGKTELHPYADAAIKAMEGNDDA